MAKRIPMAGVLALLAVAATGCGLLGIGTTSVPGGDAAIEATIEALVAAGEAQDQAALQAYLANEILTQIANAPAFAEPTEMSKGALIRSIEEPWKHLTQFNVQVRRIDRSGDQAAAAGDFVLTYASGQQELICRGTGEARFVKSGSKWLVTGVTVAAYACSPAASHDEDDRENGAVMALQATSTAASPPRAQLGVCEYLVRGAYGEQVRAVQQALKSLGYYSGLIDGDFGPMTEAAVRAFQRSASLYVDGEVGPKTYAALNQALAAKGGYIRCNEYLDRGELPAAAPGSTTLTMSSLRTGTAFETPVYIYQSVNPGPTVVFVGCIHGNEKSGYYALTEAIERGIHISRGRVVIVPAFNKIACSQNRRTLSRSGSLLNGKDFNRMFPVGKEPSYLIAKEMWALLKSQPNLAFVVDFHDGFVNSLANTLLHTRQAKAASVAKKIRDSLNAMRPARATGPRWEAHPEPISGSLIRKVGRDLNVPGILAELAGRSPGDPLSLRKEYAWRIMKMVGSEFGITISF